MCLHVADHDVQYLTTASIELVEQLQPHFQLDSSALVQLREIHANDRPEVV